jgi:molybdopterin-guanine dinucleotide biosynthesis protein A
MQRSSPTAAIWWAAMDFDAIVLAGGASRRLGGADKAEVEVGGRRLIDRAVESVRDARRVVVVGPERPVPYPVTWVRERPPEAGPAHAVAAGLEEVRRQIVVVLAVDLPLVGSALVARLVDAVGTGDGAVCTDDHGRDQMLLAAYRTTSLRARLGALGATPGASMRALVEGLDLVRIEAGVAARDCDTWDEVRAADAFVTAEVPAKSGERRP